MHWIGCSTESILDPKIQIKCVDTKNQMADMFTKGSFTRDEWNNRGISQNLRNFPHASTGGWVGSQHLLCLFVLCVFALAQVFSGFHQILCETFFLRVCAATIATVPQSCAATPVLHVS